MSVIHELKNRNVIPNWRDFKRTLQIGELVTSRKNSIIPLQFDINRSTTDWKVEKNIGTAADLLTTAFISRCYKSNEIKEALGFVIKNNSQASKSLVQIATLIQNDVRKTPPIQNNSLLEIDLKDISQFQELKNNDLLYKIINKTRNKAHKETFNPIIWIELARLYSIQGQKSKAERAILVALHLAPSNRFVLRSATRFFIHYGKSEMGLYYLKKSETIRNDPWLISAHIATSATVNRFSPFIKDGKTLIESQNFSDYDTTELASSIGTLEFKDGSFKKAKSFFSKAMNSPNDNSLAQLEWISREDSRFDVNPFNFKDVINPFEAYTLDYFNKGSWQLAYNNSLKWFFDTPFSKRPALLGSYVASCLLNNTDDGITLCELGLIANPNDPDLLNNLIYSYAVSGKLNVNNKYLNQFKSIDIKGLPDTTKITVQATHGLIAIRSGQIEMGKKIYEIAIENAERIQDEYIKNLAITHYTRELILLNDVDKEKYVSLTMKMNVKEVNQDLKLFREQVLQMIKEDENREALQKR